MKILAIDKILPTATEESIRTAVIPDAMHTWVLYTKDMVREAYFRKDRPGVVLVLECPTVEDAKTLLRTFPMVKAGVVDFDIIPLGHFVPFGTLLDKSLLTSMAD